MNDQLKILSYIPYFEDATIKKSTQHPGIVKNEGDHKSYTYGGFSYDKTSGEFMKEIYNFLGSNFDYKWMVYSMYYEHPKVIDMIDEFLLDDIKRFFFYIVRSDRFTDGNYAFFIENGVVLKLLKRLKELTDKQ